MNHRSSSLTSSVRIRFLFEETRESSNTEDICPIMALTIARGFVTPLEREGAHTEREAICERIVHQGIKQLRWEVYQNKQDNKQTNNILKNNASSIDILLSEEESWCQSDV
jgi:hypothetical protein